MSPNFPTIQPPSILPDPRFASVQNTLINLNNITHVVLDADGKTALVYFVGSNAPVSVPDPHASALIGYLKQTGPRF